MFPWLWSEGLQEERGLWGVSAIAGDWSATSVFIKGGLGRSKANRCCPRSATWLGPTFTLLAIAAHVIPTVIITLLSDYSNLENILFLRSLLLSVYLLGERNRWEEVALTSGYLCLSRYY